ncbi:unnamed protein product [Hymenolepis diminuta]|uniref:Uncharacterized protein n=1 Tax=Hymenolepis diminuta TaxID=6216 RepID=A0A564Y9I7_HYMDI|nr:unnamed protein product [Hymenolepis diminuta]
MLKKLNSEQLQVAIDENPTCTTRELSGTFNVSRHMTIYGEMRRLCWESLVAVRVVANSDEAEHQELIRPGCIEQTAVLTPKGKRELRERRERRKMCLASDSLSVFIGFRSHNLERNLTFLQLSINHDFPMEISRSLLTVLKHFRPSTAKELRGNPLSLTSNLDRKDLDNTAIYV